MAIKRVIDLEVNSGQAKTSIEDVKAFLAGADQSAGSLRKQLRDATLEVALMADKFGDTSREAVEAAKKAAILRDRIGDAKNLTDAFNPDAKFRALTSSLSGVASGFAAVQGGMSLLGLQSGKTEEVLLKVQSAMALSQGLQGLGEARDSFKQLGAVAKNALAGIKSGIAATGIGLLLVALGAVVAYWDDISEAVSGVSKEQKDLNKQTDANLKSSQAKLDTIAEQDNILKLQGKSENDILKIKIAQTDEVILATKAQIQNTKATTDAQIKIAERNKDILVGILDSISIPMRVLLKTVDKVGEVFGKNFGLVEGFNNLIEGAAGFVFNPENVKAEGEAAVKEQEKALLKLQNQRAGFELQTKGGTSATDKAKTETKEDPEIKAEQERQDAVDKMRRDFILKQQDLDAESALQKLQLDRNRALAEMEALGATESEKYEARKYYAKLITDEELRIQDEANAAKLANKKLTADEEIEIEKQVAEAKKAIQEGTFATISNGIGLLKTVFEKNKGMQKALLVAESLTGIAKTIISTKAANAAITLKYAALPGGELLTARAIAINNIGAAIGIGANIAATAKALKSLGGGSVSSPQVGNDSGGGGGSANSTPQFNVVGNSAVNQIATTIGQQQPIQAYVVANQVTTQQALDRNIINNASLG
jgi:hypothetical protein